MRGNEMDLAAAKALSPEEQGKLDVETKIKLTEAYWQEMNERDKENVVFLSVMAVIHDDEVELPVIFKVMELAEADGLDVPPWRDLQEEYLKLVDIFGEN
jgi:hypothetical protein